MDSLINIGLLALGTLGAALAFFGETVRKSEATPLKRVTRLGWVSVALILSSFSIGVLKEIRQSSSRHESEIREAQRDSLLRATSRLQAGQLAREASKRADKAVAEMQEANEERIRLAQGTFDSLPREQMDVIAERTNRLQQDWRTQREETEVDVNLLAPLQAGLFDSWRKARQAIDRETRCIEDGYVSFQRRRAPADMCSAAVQASAQAVTAFRGQLRLSFDSSAPTQ